MRKLKSQVLSLLTISLLLQAICAEAPALARSSAGSHDEPWNSDHIDQLPADVRNAVLHNCPGIPHATHYFATYLDHARTVRLHFENLRCDGEQSFRRGASCLHEEFVALGTHYRLVKHFYAPCSD